MRLVSSIKVAERIPIDFGRLVRLTLGPGRFVSKGQFDTIEQNNNSALILCLFIYLFIYLLIYLFIYFNNVISPNKIKYIP